MDEKQRLFKAAYCETVADLYRPESIRAINVAAGKYLQQRRLTPTELLHSTTHQLAFNDAGSTLAQASQTAAIQQIKGRSLTVTQRVKELYDLAEAVIKETKTRLEKNPPPDLNADNVAEWYATLRSVSDEERRFRIFAALTPKLGDAGSWGGKFDYLMEVLSWPSGGEFIEEIDIIVASLIRLTAARKEILGERKPNTKELDRLLAIHEGEPVPEAEGEEPARADVFHKLPIQNRMPETKETIRGLAMQLITADERLSGSTEVATELTTVLEIAKRLQRDKGFFGGDDTEEALERRFGRLLSNETIDETMADISIPVDRVTRAFELHRSIVGKRGRSYLEEYVGSLLADPQIRRLMDGIDNPVDGLRRLGKAHAAARAARIPTVRKEKLLESLVREQLNWITQKKIFQQLEGGNRPTAAKVMAFLDLISNGAFADGEIANEARRRTFQLMKQKDFQTSLVAGAESSTIAKQRLSDLESRLRKAHMRH